MENNSTTTGGVSFAGLLFIAFLVLKLTHVINWSWWCVTAPIWIPLAIALLFLLYGIIYQLFIEK